MKKSVIKKEKNTLIKELNKEWRMFEKQVESIIKDEIKSKPSSVSFIIRRSKKCEISLCDILESELKKLDLRLDEIKNN
jgi:hypothetical protein